MDDSGKRPDVDAIVQNLRTGMDDTETLPSNDPQSTLRCELRGALRQANATADTLGRCGGSLRGKLCNQLARIALPVVEQLNRHHAAVVTALTRLADTHDTTAKLEIRLAELEAELQTLKQEPTS